MTPAISVLMAVRDGERFLDEAVASVIAQTREDFEFVIVDDGSNDRTPTLLRRWSDKDARIRVVPQPTAGLAVALNRAASLARGIYLARQDADDVSLPDRFARQAAYLDAHAAVAAVGSSGEIIDAEGATVGMLRMPSGPTAVRRTLLAARTAAIHGAMTIRRAAFEAVGGYREAFAFSQDFDLWLRMSERFDLDNLPETLYRFRVHDASVTATHRTRQAAMAAVMLAFTDERRRYGADSYADFAARGADLERFVEEYRLRAMVDAWRGEFLLLGLGRPREARTHLWRALRHGRITPRTIGLSLWSATGLPWPRRSP